MAIFAVVTGKVTSPAVPAVIVPLCVPTVTVLTNGAATVRVNVPDCVLSMVSLRVLVTAATVEVLPARVSVPLLLFMVTWPETVTPVGRGVTDTV